MNRDTFALLARYNDWANRRLYRAAGSLTHDECRADRGLFFRSIHATLNHILVTDRIWMKRFTGSGEAPDRLDAILFEDIPELRRAREAEDARIAAWVDGLDADVLQGTFAYRPVSRPADLVEPLAPALLHLFNHQTHHRGQCHAALTGLGREAPSLDMIAFLRQARAEA